MKMKAFIKIFSKTIAKITNIKTINLINSHINNSILTTLSTNSLRCHTEINTMTLLSFHKIKYNRIKWVVELNFYTIKRKQTQLT